MNSYTLGYHSVPCSLFYCSNCSSFSYWELFQVGFSIPLTCPRPFATWALPYFLKLGDVPSSSCIFPALALESAFSSGALVFFFGETRIWALGVHIASKPSAERARTNPCVYTYVNYSCMSTCIHTEVNMDPHSHLWCSTTEFILAFPP